MQDEHTTLAALTPDRENRRRHNPRNVGMIEDSLQEVGAGRSIVLDESGTILAGNATVEAAGNVGIERVRIIETDGNEIIAVRRSNLSAAQKKRLALYDNRTAELADWDIDQIALDVAAGDNLDGIFYEVELEDLLEQGTRVIAEDVDDDEDESVMSNAKTAIFKPLFSVTDVYLLERAIVATGQRTRGEALLMLCTSYLGAQAQTELEL